MDTNEPFLPALHWEGAPPGIPRVPAIAAQEDVTDDITSAIVMNSVAAKALKCATGGLTPSNADLAKITRIENAVLSVSGVHVPTVVKNEMASIRAEVETVKRSANKRRADDVDLRQILHQLSVGFKELHSKVDALSAKADAKIDALSAKVDTLSAKVDTLSAKVDELRKDVADNTSVMGFNMRARISNSKYCPVSLAQIKKETYDGEAKFGTIPTEFPATTEDLRAMTNESISAFARFYNEDFEGITTTDRLKKVANFLGVSW